jgi:thiamine transport system ATP-binding protein
MLTVRGLTVALQGEQILDGVDLEVADDEVMAVLGPSGAGKTTLLRSIAGLQRPSEGSVAWDGDDLAGTAVEQRGFGLMFQDYALFPHQSVGTNVGFGLKMLGRPPEQAGARITEVLEWVGLSGYESRRVTNLSGGEQQRVALARALAPSPRLLMLDEPLGSLDRTLRERLIVELRDLLVAHSITALYVTHDQQEAFTIADRVLVINRGKVAQTGTPESVYRQPVDEWTARFLGFRNIVEAELSAGMAATSWSRFPVQTSESGTKRLVIPPDELMIDPMGDVEGTVASRSFRGGHYLLQVAVIDGPILDVEVSGATPMVGETVSLRVAGTVVL